MEYISEKVSQKMNNVVNNNLEKLVSFKGMPTDISMFFLNIIPAFFRAHRAWINAIVVREETLFWKVTDLLFFGSFSLFLFSGLTALYFAFFVATLPFALVFDALPSLFSKKHRNNVSLSRKVRKLNMYLQKSIKRSGLDCATTKTQKRLSNLCYRFERLDDKKVNKLIEQIEQLSGGKMLTKDQVPQYKIEEYCEHTVNCKSQKPLIDIEQNKELYRAIKNQQDELNM